ncbi:MAG: LptA/OstA family protein [Alphaproteobacteria bacterium]|nr:LptA/OstA family protein [Alphaproteobacteria bacterium]
MRFSRILWAGLMVAMAGTVQAKPTTSGSNPLTDSGGQVEITADQSLEWYQDQHIYVARGNARAVRGEMVVEADLLTAHERAKPEGGKSKNPDNAAGDIDKLTAEGNVRITDPKQRVSGEHAVYDLDQHVAVITGKNLKYETEKETVTARDSLEYWDARKMAVARGNARAVGSGRHIEADTLTAEFRETPAGATELWKMTAAGGVTVITKSDVARGDRAVYDINRNIAVLSGNVRITRNDGTQLTGDVGEVDFKQNQSRLMNASKGGRVRALLGAKASGKMANSKSDQHD